MNPNNFGIIKDVKLPKILAVCHRGTQTNDSANSSNHSLLSKGTSPGQNLSEDSSGVKIFEFSQIVQDSEHPESITIVKDTFSEEIHDHSSSDKSQNSTSNRYKYCREVIKPFLKDFSTECQTSDDEIIQDVLDSVREDFPDYKPCFKNDNTGGENINKPTSDQQTNETDSSLSCHKVKASSPIKSDIGGSFFPVSVCPSKPDSNSKSKTGTSDTSMDKKIEDDYDDPYDPCTKPKCPRKSSCPEEIKPCKKPKALPRDPPPPFCADDFGPKCTRKLTTGCESAENLKELAKQRKKSCQSIPGESKVDLLPPPSTPPEQKSVMAAHCEALATVKQAASLVLGKVYEKTKDTVSLIRTESAKHLEKIRASKSECDDICDSSRPGSPKKDNLNDTCTTEVSNIISKRSILENLERLDTLDAEDVLHKMVEKMESTISMISEHIDFDTIANILKSDEKNSYDKPTTPPQVKVRPAHHSPDEQPNLQNSIHDSIHESIQANINTANNMFTAIKSKIFAIFSDVRKGTDTNESLENTDDDES